MALPYHHRYDYVPIVERADYDWPGAIADHVKTLPAGALPGGSTD